jgi:hypothetical protein
MNERFKELALEAGYEVDMFGIGHWDMPECKKFAELIVRECVKSALSLQDTAINNQWTLDETFHVIVDTIAEDFDMQDIFRS